MIARPSLSIPLFAAALLAGGCSDLGPAAPEPSSPAFQAASAACWGQASAVFAQMGLMGEHASGFETPRAGLRNLARALYDAGVIPDDTMAALGAFVASTLGLEIDACR